MHGVYTRMKGSIKKLLSVRVFNQIWQKWVPLKILYTEGHLKVKGLRNTKTQKKLRNANYFRS